MREEQAGLSMKGSVDVDGRQAERATKMVRGCIRKPVVLLSLTRSTRGRLNEQTSLHMLKGVLSVGELFFDPASPGIFPMQIYIFLLSALCKFLAV